MSHRYLRFGLRSFLLAVLAVGAILSWGVRHHLQSNRYRFKEIVCGRYYRCHAQWDFYYGKPRLVYMHVTLLNGKPRRASAGGTIRTRPVAEGLSLLCSGVFLDGRKIPGSDAGGIWVYVWHAHKVLPVPVGDNYTGLTPEEFARLEETDLWREEIEPFVRHHAELNRQERNRQWQEEYGARADADVDVGGESLGPVDRMKSS